MAINTRSGAALIEIGEGASKITITDQQQLNDATLRVERDEFSHRAQSSSKPVKYIITGLEGKLEISINDVSLAQIANVFYGSTLIEETTASAITSDVNFELIKQKVVVSDFAGTEILGQKIVVKPYPQLTDPGVKPTTTSYGGKTYGSIALAEDAWAADITKYNAWVASWVTFPNGAITSINGTNLAFGLNTQQEIKITLTSLPDATGQRIIFGDASLT